jgi:hypothetical protein
LADEFEYIGAIMFCWAITTKNLLRTSWNDDIVIDSATTAISGYPSDNVLDGNRQSAYKVNSTQAIIVIDRGSSAPTLEYLYFIFNYANLPTSVKIEHSTDNNTYTEIDNNLDRGVATTLTSALDGTSRILPVADETNIHVGNYVELDDDVQTATKYLVIGVGSNYIEIDKYPLAYKSGSTVVVVPDTHCLCVLANDEDDRYLKITITCASIAEVLEICGFSVSYVFDGTQLPLNPFPVDITEDMGSILRTVSGHGVGRMNMSPPIRKYSIGIGKILKDGLAILEWLQRQEGMGFLTDSGEYIEAVITGMSGGRRASSDAELIAHTRTITFEEI